MMSRCLVVMQPTFLPWAGYFNLMAQADDFVLLDDVQLEKQSWQTRNRLLIGGHIQWVGLPVRHVRLDQSIIETELVDAARWRDKLNRSFTLNYSRHPHFADAREVMDVLFSVADDRLAGINESVIRFVGNRLGIDANIYRSSETGTSGCRSDRLIALCAHFGATEYLSPLGSAQYLEADDFPARAPAALRFQDYVPQPYPQKGTKQFVSHLSIVDVLANVGWEATRNYVLAGTVEHLAN